MMRSYGGIANKGVWIISTKKKHTHIQPPTIQIAPKDREGTLSTTNVEQTFSRRM